MNNDDNASLRDGGIPQRAVSLYGQNDGMDDFPVLKAFQQYIDAEQEKARKRILSLGIFFGLILLVVIAVFMVLLYGINQRNQALGDRLFEYAMKDSERRTAVETRQNDVPPTNNDAAITALSESLKALQKQIENNAVQQQTIAKATPKQEDIERERQIREEAEKIQREKEQLELDKKKLSAERERLHQLEIENQRRKLYPELYEFNSNRPVRGTPSRTRQLTDEDIREIIREAYPESESENTQAKPKLPAQDKSAPNKADDSSVEELDDAIEYFKDDEYSIPVDVKGSSSKVNFTVPVD